MAKLTETDEEKKKRLQELRRKRIRAVCAQTGWDYETARKKMIRARNEVGATFEYYLGFRLWECTEEQQKQYFLKRDADIIVNKFNTDKKNIRFAWNKQLFLPRFRDYLGRPWMVSSSMDEKQFLETFAGQKKLIYKPKNASAGAGITIFDMSRETLQEVYKKVLQMPDGVVEGFVSQHPDMQKLSLNGINTIRVVTLCTAAPYTGLETNKVYFAYAAVRMCRGEAYTDNAHQGGMVAALDLDTGRIVTDAFDYAGQVHKVHPDTGTTIEGFQVPYVQEMKEMLEKACRLVPGYFGWDVAISENGPVLIEVNSHPGAELLQLPYVPRKQGMRHVMEKFITAEPADERVPDRPYGLKISDISREGIEFYWKKLAVADGYEVFRAYDKEGPYELIYTAPRRNIGTYRDGDFDHSKKIVYYTVRSYVKNSQGDPVFSELVAPAAAEYVTELRIDRAVTYMYDGIRRKLKAVYGWGEPEDGVWASTNPAVAAVDQEGMITGIATGACEILYSSPSLGRGVTSHVVVNRAGAAPLHELPVRYHLNESTGHWENPAAEKTDQAVIMMVGDLMCGKLQMTRQYDPVHGWDFTDSFAYVREITASADLSIANLETLLAPGWPYMSDEVYINNFNNCNAPSRYLEAVRYGGFDVTAMANNHNCDGGVRALLETIGEVDRYRFPRTGVFLNDQEKRYLILDVNGIKVGFMAYMTQDTGFNNKDRDFTQQEKDVHLNIFNKERAEKDVKACRADGAEYIIFYMHWGKKNFRTITDEQRREAMEAAEAGADYIVGANPHLVQVYDLLKTTDGREVPCFYSTGNFQTIMNQVPGNKDSVIVRICLTRDADGRVVLKENNYIPCHCYVRIDDNQWAPVAVSDNWNRTVPKARKKEFYDYIIKTIGSKVGPL